jgi:hypothetical protein
VQYLQHVVAKPDTIPTPHPTHLLWRLRLFGAPMEVAECPNSICDCLIVDYPALRGAWKEKLDRR